MHTNILTAKTFCVTFGVKIGIFARIFTVGACEYKCTIFLEMHMDANMDANMLQKPSNPLFSQPKAQHIDELCQTARG
jgi:hypothetical protein